MANKSDKTQTDQTKPGVGLGEDEILVRDASGEFKILKAGELIPLEGSALKKEEVSQPAPKITINDLIVEVTERSNLVLESAALQNRLKEVIISRLKDVRDPLETKAVLVAEVSRGGLGLSSEQADKLISFIDAELQKKEVQELLPQIESPKLAPEQPTVPPPPPQPRPGPAKPIFDFYPEDEEEIKKIKEQVGAPTPTELTKINQISQELISRFKLAITEPGLRSRFNGAIISRLKDIRDALETKDTLTKNPAEGGLGLSSEQADGVIRELNRMVGLVIKPATTKDIKEITGPRQPLKIAPPPPAPKPTPRAPLPQMKRPTEEGARPQMVDVKFTPKLVGPVEELARLNLIDFRRLAKDPVAAVGKISDKINLLEEESFTQRLAGVKAWQSSEVYQLYLEIGRESLRTGQPISSVIRNRLAENKPTLEEAEVLAIMELNKELKF